MEIFVNGQPRTTGDALSVAQLLAELDLSQQRLAVEVNKDIVPRSTYADHVLRPGDQVELVRAIGGG